MTLKKWSKFMTTYNITINLNKLWKNQDYRWCDRLEIIQDILQNDEIHIYSGCNSLNVGNWDSLFLQLKEQMGIDFKFHYKSDEFMYYTWTSDEELPLYIEVIISSYISNVKKYLSRRLDMIDWGSYYPSHKLIVKEKIQYDKNGDSLEAGSIVLLYRGTGDNENGFFTSNMLINDEATIFYIDDSGKFHIGESEPKDYQYSLTVL